MKIKWWDRKWKWILFSMFFPILVMPLICVLFFPHGSVMSFFINGLFYSIIIGSTLKLIRTIEIWGIRIIIIILGGTVLFTFLFLFFRLQFVQI